MSTDIRSLFKPPILAAFGNPILDMCVVLEDDRILVKYDLAPDGQKEISQEEEKEILQDLGNRYEIKYCAGGAAQNTLRIFQWIVGVPHYSVFIGGIGNDSQGKLLEEIVQHSGVHTRYAYHEGYPTATCLSLINGENRSLVAHIGAANIYEPCHLHTSENMEILSKVKIIYIEGFFLTHSFPTALKVAEFCKSRGIPLAFNLSGVYVCERYSSEVLELVKQADIVFGNGFEFKMLNKVLDLKCDNISGIALVIQKISGPFDKIGTKSKMWMKPLQHGRVVVITQGNESVIYALSDDKVHEMKVCKIDSHLVKDSTGAGDAFVAGFLAGMFYGRDIGVCVQWGCWAAQQIIQMVGCTVPDHLPVDLFTL